MPKIEIPIIVDMPENWADQVVEAMKKDPNAEWVDIVRCRECLHRDTSPSPRTIWCEKFEKYFAKEFYCAFGEREEKK